MLPSFGRHMRPARHKFPNAILSDRKRAHDLDRRANVQGSDQDQKMLRFPMISQWTCHRPKRARKRRSSGLCPPRTGPSAKVADGPASAFRNSNGTSDPWHAPQWAASQIGRRARLHDVGGRGGQSVGWAKSINWASVTTDDRFQIDFFTCRQRGLHAA